MNNKKIFISGRVSGIKYDTAKRNFSKWEKYWKEQGYEVVNPINLCNKDWSWLKCMCVCLWNLIKCDSTFFMGNYIYSKGSRIELFVARLFRKNIWEQDYN